MYINSDPLRNTTIKVFGIKLPVCINCLSEFLVQIMFKVNRALQYIYDNRNINNMVLC
jgi:hypothetical protein